MGAKVIGVIRRTSLFNVLIQYNIFARRRGLGWALRGERRGILWSGFYSPEINRNGCRRDPTSTFDFTFRLVSILLFLFFYYLQIVRNLDKRPSSYVTAGVYLRFSNDIDNPDI